MSCDCQPRVVEGVRSELAVSLLSCVMLISPRPADAPTMEALVPGLLSTLTRVRSEMSFEVRRPRAARFTGVDVGVVEPWETTFTSEGPQGVALNCWILECLLVFLSGIAIV